jgi:hypothetical protein
VSNSDVSFSWDTQGVLLEDGSTLTVPAGSLAYTGLSASTTYYTYWYINAETGVLGQTNANPPASSPDSVLSAQTSGNGRIAIPVISFTTLAASNISYGGGTGGGRYTCPESAELVETQDRGVIRAGDVKVGDFLKGKSFKTSADVFHKVIQVQSVQSMSWRIVEGHRVSPCEPIYSEGKWMPAYRAKGATLDSMLGHKVLISLESDEYDEQNYYLTDGNALLIHNNLAPNPC